MTGVAAIQPSWWQTRDRFGRARLTHGVREMFRAAMGHTGSCRLTIGWSIRIQNSNRKSMAQRSVHLQADAAAMREALRVLTGREASCVVLEAKGAA